MSAGPPQPGGDPLPAGPGAAPAGPLLAVRGLRVAFRTARGLLRAVDGVDLDLARGETLGLVGESGCGKSTLARAVAGLVTPSAGSVRLAGEELTGRSRASLRSVRRRLQLVFQDPYASLNPRLRIGAAVAEPLRIHRVVPASRREARVCELFEWVGLDPALRGRYPHALSGGQRQRVGLARALALEPDVLLLDEPVSALDVSVQAQILNLLEDLRKRLGLSLLLIAHHLAVVRHMSDRVAVMYLGRVIEVAPRDALYTDPQHPYTQALLASIPSLDPAASRPRAPLRGELPSPFAPATGCAFRPRCALAVARCAQEAPGLRALGGGRAVACHEAGAPGGSPRSPVKTEEPR